MQVIHPKVIFLTSHSQKHADLLRRLGRIDFEFEMQAPEQRIIEKMHTDPSPSVFVLDWDSVPDHGLQLLKDLKKNLLDSQVVVISENKNVKDAIRIIQAGASDYLNPTVDFERLSSLVRAQVENILRTHELKTLRAVLSHIDDHDIFIGESPEIRKVMSVVDSIASLPTNVLLYGESGTGKEIMAQLIHKKSHIAGKPFVTVNLPSIPPNLVESVLFGHEKGSFTGAHRRHFGKFELADGGTIFLDEIGDLHFDVQSKLLRIIQEGEMERVGGNQVLKVNVRLIAASKIDLKLAVKSGKFRDDLFYRLNVVPIALPPLRKRLEDLEGFCDIFIKRYATKFSKNIKGLSPKALSILRAYRWPGNIRELENLFERIIAILNKDYKEIAPEHIPLEYVFASFSERTPTTMNLDQAMVQFERNLIVKALRKNNWNRKETARTLGISYGILKYKVRKLNISIPGKSAGPRSHGPI